MAPANNLAGASGSYGNRVDVVLGRRSAHFPSIPENAENHGISVVFALPGNLPKRPEMSQNAPLR
jgi:hypothetical protein